MHLSWAVRRLTPTQAKYIRTFYGDAMLHQLEALEHRSHPHRAPARTERSGPIGAAAARSG